MKIALITGSYPPENCGVGDYTHRLSESLRLQQVEVEVIHNRLRTPLQLSCFNASLKKINPDVIHLQYPTLGYGYSLLPQVVANRQPMVVTIHEISQAHLLRKLSLYGFSTRSQRLVFTSRFELEYAVQCAPWVRNRSVVIPIGTNIAVPPKFEGARSGIAYFGLIRPNKGIEAFLEFAAKLQAFSTDYPAYVLGIVPEIHLSYYERLKHLSKDISIDWIIGLDHEQVAERLSHMALGYLPYPDGASERRASLLAMFAARVPVITSHGPQTPLAFRELVEFASTVDEAVRKAMLIAESEATQAKLIDAGHAYLMDLSWDNIAQRHIMLYKELLRPL